MNEPTKFCINCGKKIPVNATFCPFCGADQANANQSDNPGNAEPNLQSASTGNTIYNESPVPGLITSTKLLIRGFLVLDKRMGRADYWWAALGFSLLNIVFWVVWGIVFGLVTGVLYLNTYPVVIIWEILVFVLLAVAALAGLWVTIAGITAQIRRLHDAGYNGALWLLSFIPGVGGIIILVLLCQPSRQNANPYLYL